MGRVDALGLPLRKAGPWPFIGVLSQAVFYGVVMNVVQMPLEIVVVADDVIVVTPLPQRLWRHGHGRHRALEARNHGRYTRWPCWCHQQMHMVVQEHIHESGWMGIGFSLLVVGVAALNLVLDFDMIEKADAHGVPKYMEWYCAFALMITLVWLYLEILRLLGKTRR